MKVWVERDDKTHTIEYSGKAYGLLKQLGLNDQEVVISQNGELVTKDALLKETDEIKLLSVISGG